VPKKTALVHEWFSPRSLGGAEKVVQAIDKLLFEFGTETDLFALVNGETNQKGSWLFKRSVNTSFIQKLPYGVSHVQKYLPLLPFAIEQLNVTDYPLVISSNHLVAKGVLTSPDQLHVCYVHTPVRYAWDQMNIYLERSSLKYFGLEPLLRWQLYKLRQWDQISSARVDCLFANSRFTSKRIAKYWRRDSTIIHPPVSVERFNWNKPRDDYYLSICRLVPNKRVDLVVRAFNQLQLPLIVVGDGPEKQFLKKIAGHNVTILGYQNSERIKSLMEHCRAFVYAGVEDFGITPVEAMAAGAPVVALAKGGLLDTVRCLTENLESATGILFKDQTVQSLVEAINWFEEKKIWKNLKPEAIRQRANCFSTESFNLRFKEALIKAWNLHKKS